MPKTITNLSLFVLLAASVAAAQELGTRTGAEPRAGKLPTVDVEGCSPLKILRFSPLDRNFSKWQPLYRLPEPQQ